MEYTPIFKTNNKILDVEDKGKYYLVTTEHSITENLITKSAYSKKDGGYIGDEKFAKYLTEELEIEPQTYGDLDICSIGYNPETETWYGWSHRAIVGFKKGNKIFEERFGNEDTPFIEHGRFTIKTLDDAKKSAEKFAEYVARVKNE